MSKPTDPGSSTPASRAPTSGRKHIDPTRYQMDTVPAELVAKIAQMKIESLPEGALKPPPLFDKRPIVGRIRRMGVWSSRHKIALLIGCFVGLCAVVTMAIWQWGSKVDERRDEGQAVERNAEAPPTAPVRNESSPTAGTTAAEPPSTPRTPSVDTPKPETSEKPQATPKVVTSKSRTELPPATNVPKRTTAKSAKASGDQNNGTDVMDTPFVRKKPRSPSP